MKQKRFNFRISDKDDTAIRANAEKAKMSLTDYIVSSCLGKQIIIIDGIKPLIQQVRRVGITLNRLEILAREGKVRVVNLNEAEEEFATLNNRLKAILERKRW